MAGIKVGQMLGNSCWIATKANKFLHLIIPWEKKKKKPKQIISYW